MSIEAEINALTLAVQSLTATVERLISAQPAMQVVELTAEPEKPARVRRTREQIAADEAAKKAAEAPAPEPVKEPIKEQEPAPVEEDPFADAFAEPEPPKAYTQADVKAAFIKLAGTDGGKGKPVAIAILEKYTDKKDVSAIDPAKYADVMADIAAAKV